MTGYVTTAQGRRFQLPVLLSWELTYTAGVPCDSFWLRCPWEEREGVDPEEWYRFEGLEKGERVFYGVIDECEVTRDGGGTHLELSGRGMAALLLDNEAAGQDYATATLEDILRDHVYPYGIQVAGKQAMPGVRRFSVATGSSEWSVLYDFVRYHGGVAPRFDRKGQLVLDGWTDSESLAITDDTPVTSLSLRRRRYGMLSEIWVRDRTRQAVERVKNTSFLEQGGCCRRVMTMPGRSDFQTMRYSGQFQLDKSQGERLRLTAAIPIPFYGKPGDLVRLQRTGWGGNGYYRAVEVQVQWDEQGSRTLLELAQPTVVL